MNLPLGLTLLSALISDYLLELVQVDIRADIYVPEVAAVAVLYPTEIADHRLCVYGADLREFRDPLCFSAKSQADALPNCRFYRVELKTEKVEKSLFDGKHLPVALHTQRHFAEFLFDGDLRLVQAAFAG